MSSPGRDPSIEPICRPTDFELALSAKSRRSRLGSNSANSAMIGVHIGSHDLTHTSEHKISVIGALKTRREPSVGARTVTAVRLSSHIEEGESN
jgi:hypothetical protein